MAISDASIMYVSLLSQTSGDTTFLSKATDYFSQRLEAINRRKESLKTGILQRFICDIHRQILSSYKKCKVTLYSIDTLFDASATDSF